MNIPTLISNSNLTQLELNEVPICTQRGAREFSGTQFKLNFNSFRKIELKMSFELSLGLKVVYSILF